MFLNFSSYLCSRVNCCKSQSCWKCLKDGWDICISVSVKCILNCVFLHLYLYFKRETAIKVNAYIHTWWVTHLYLFFFSFVFLLILYSICLHFLLYLYFSVWEPWVYPRFYKSSTIWCFGLCDSWLCFVFPSETFDMLLMMIHGSLSIFSLQMCFVRRNFRISSRLIAHKCPLDDK